MIRHPDPPPRALPMRIAVVLIGGSLVLGVVGIFLTAWAAVSARHHLADSFEQKIVALEAQVTAMCQFTPDPATCKPVTQAPIVLVVPPTAMVTTTTTTLPFPPSTLAPPTPAPANPPATVAQAPTPAPESTTTTTTAPPPPTTPPTLAPCTSLPVVGCVGTRASRSSTRTLDWEALRECESGGDYGAYQFDARTWQSLGYDGLPSDAPSETQDEAAHLLYNQRGAQPWPVCGRRLTS